MKYQCSECGKPIGLMANIKGEPTLYKCPRYGVGGPQIVERQHTKKRKRRPKNAPLPSVVERVSE